MSTLTLETTGTRNPDGSMVVGGRVTYADGSTGALPETVISAATVALARAVLPGLVQPTLLAATPPGDADVARTVATFLALLGAPQTATTPVTLSPAPLTITLS